jgi:tricorn protease
MGSKHAWQRFFLYSCFLLGFLCSAALAQSTSPIKLAADPALSPDGRTLAFAWNGDIWLVPSKGGRARPLTHHEANDAQPAFSPDGSEIAFVSDRGEGRQVYVMPLAGGKPKQVTFHSEGYALAEWTPAGDRLLVSGDRDHFWRKPQRFFWVSPETRQAEPLLFDAQGDNATLSPNGRQCLFTREGTGRWRKGYVGSQASQIWHYDLDSQQFKQLLSDPSGCRWPLWKPEGTGFYYVGAGSGSFNLWEYDLATGQERQLTFFDDDSVVSPCLSRDGSTLVFGRLFDLYRFRPGQDQAPQRLKIRHALDDVEPSPTRKILDQATQLAFSHDGLEVAFIAGGDLWVMDTELREPRPVTVTPEEERDPVFSVDGDSLLYVSDTQGQCDLWRAQRADPNTYWWRNQAFTCKRLTQDADVESALRVSPKGDWISYIKGRGDLWIMKADGRDAECLLRSWNAPQYDWSPDDRWIVYALDDNDFNRDVWIMPRDGSQDPVNVSRHPYDEGSPLWSPDGKIIAFTGDRLDRETDLFYVWLRAQDDQKSKRDRTLEKALKAMEEKRRKKGSRSVRAESKAVKDPNDPHASGKTGEPNEPGAADGTSEAEGADDANEVEIDFTDIHKRIRRVAIPHSRPTNLFWSHDSKKLAFRASLDGKSGTYTISIPDDLKPQRLTEKTGSQARWLREGNQIVWLSGGSPARLSSKGEETRYSFNARQSVDQEQHWRAAFDQVWRLMRDHWYDERMGNRNWQAMRRKYGTAAARAVDITGFSQVINMMLGELNGSHLGFYAQRSSDGGGGSQSWSISTAHLGVRFDASHRGPGLKVRDVLPSSPADRQESRIVRDEIILSIDGVTVDPAMDLSEVLNGTLERDISLQVQDVNQVTRDVVLRPISYGRARSLLYEQWLEQNQQRVANASNNTLGYVHIQGMNWSSFQKLERELYAVGAGKDGLIIDVRENGGGFTADHLLTMLCQPSHAMTVPRGGGRGYPQDRRVYATWNKPIAVLCNQNSFSNTEIFSHAVKTLKRGKVVGVPTAGCVISTGGTSVMDVGFLRMPFRGWYVLPTGEDMERNGAVPDVVLWNPPGQWPRGEDDQLDEAVTVLQEDVRQWKDRAQPALRKATER